MLRLETRDGWWLITHPDHARLAGAFARHWGNAEFARPEPRQSVLHAIDVHDDGWAARDTNPSVTSEGKPAAFSHELVGKYSAFEEIDLADYLAVRESAVEKVEAQDTYAALLVSMHTVNLLTQRADRSTIRPEQLPLLDSFLVRQESRQTRLRNDLRSGGRFAAEDVTDSCVDRNFKLLQAMDNLSLLSCVAFMGAASLLHRFRITDGVETVIAVHPQAIRSFRLAPYPFDKAEVYVEVPARFVAGRTFRGHELAEKFALAEVTMLPVRICGKESQEDGSRDT